VGPREAKKSWSKRGTVLGPDQDICASGAYGTDMITSATQPPPSSTWIRVTATSHRSWSIRGEEYLTSNTMSDNATAPTITSPSDAGGGHSSHPPRSPQFISRLMCNSRKSEGDSRIPQGIAQNAALNIYEGERITRGKRCGDKYKQRATGWRVRGE